MSLLSRIIQDASTENLRPASFNSGTMESLFERVMPGVAVPTNPPVLVMDPIFEESSTKHQPTAFSSHVESVLRFGTPPEEPDIAELEHTPDIPDYDPVEDTTQDYDDVEQSEDFADDQDESSEDLIEAAEALEAPEVAQEALPPSIPSFALMEPVAPQQPDLVHARASEQKNDSRATQIVDDLFDRMKGAWGDREPSPSPQPPEQGPAPISTITPRQEIATTSSQKMLLAENKRELTSVIRSEFPRLMKGEFVTVLRTEIMKAVRGEIIRALREEFETVHRLLGKMTDRIYSLEPRLAKLEGSFARDIEIKFPKGMVQIDAPVTVPEREVKIAAPINVQPPSVTFDEGAITVNFQKGQKGARQVVFDRDGHNTIQGAEIIDVPER